MTDTPSRPILTLPDRPPPTARIYLYGKYSRGLRLLLGDLGLWNRIHPIPRNTPTTPPGNVIATEDVTVQALLGDDVDFGSLWGSAVTDDAGRWVFVANERVGRCQWELWVEAVNGDTDRLLLLPAICIECDAAWIWERDPRGVGWCRKCGR